MAERALINLTEEERDLLLNKVELSAHLHSLNNRQPVAFPAKLGG
jgi:hypothetical protein